MAVDSTKKSSRLLQSRRYTLETLADSQEAFTRVLDLGSVEIYAQESLIPSSNLPFSGSSQSGSYYTTAGTISSTATGQDLLKYWYQHKMTKGTGANGRQVWFFMDPPGALTGVDPTGIQPGQQNNFISPKYSVPSLAETNTENPGNPGYLTTVRTSTNGITFSAAINPGNYSFDYKTGVLQWNTAAVTPATGDVYISVYQYVGRTLASDQILGYSGSFSGSFQGDGTGLTNIPASGIVGLNLTQVATTNVTASVSEGSTSFTLTNTGTPILTVDNTGAITTAGSASFKDTTITGSLLVTQNFTVLGTASFTRVTGSEIVIGSPTITLNTDDPVIRFGGMVVVDSGSFGTDSTGSLLWDSEKNHWIYARPGGGSYTSGLLISGPRHTGSLGDEEGTVKYAVLRGQGGDHLESSNMFYTGSNLTINKGGTGSISGVELLGDLEVTGSFRITSGASGSFSGSFQGDGNGLTNLPASSIVGLNLTQIADSNISASVSSIGSPFKVTSGGSTIFEVTSTSGITVFSTASLKDVEIIGNTTISDSLEISNNLQVNTSTLLSGSNTLEGSTTLSGSIQTSGSTTLTGNNTLVGTTEITGSATIISDAQVTGSINVLGSTNTVGTSTVDGDMVITGSLTVSGSSTLTNIGPAEFTGSTGISGILNVDGTSSVNGTSLVSGSTILSGSLDIEGTSTITGSVFLTGSLNMKDSQISASNINVGNPTTRTWGTGLEGSVFSLYDGSSNVSDILRFVAGALSASYALPTPNTRLYTNATSNIVNASSTGFSSTSIVNGQKLSLGFTSSTLINSNFIPALNYGISKGWSTAGTLGDGAGTAPYSSFISTAGYNNYNSTYLRYTGTPGSGTGGNGSGYFGLGRVSSDSYTVRINSTMSYSSTASISSPTPATATYFYTSSLEITLPPLGTSPSATSNGLVLQVITSSNPALIDNIYQDGYFTNTVVTNVTRSYGTADTTGTSISSSGYYRFHNVEVQVKSGSSAFRTVTISQPLNQLYLPLTQIAASMSATPPTIAPNDAGAVSLTIAPSRSLSGAPYLTAGNSTWDYSITASNVFDPAFYAGEVFNQANSTSAAGSWGISSNTVNCNTNGINTTGKVYDQAGNLKNSGFPNYNDVIRSTAAVTQTIAASTNNINQTGIGTTIATLSTTAKGYNNSNQTIDSSRIIYYHESGSYGQPISSGSLGIYGRAQAYDESTLTGTTENFTGENNRVQINDKILSGSYTTADKFTTGSYVTDNLTELDLQVKPGYLIRPGGSYKYWLPTPAYTGGRTGNGTYRYYARAFRVTNNKASLTISTTGGTLGPWYNSGTNYAVAVIFQSVWDRTGNPILWDPTVNNSNAAIATGVTRDDLYNPFDTAVSIYGVGQVPSTPNSIAFNDIANQFVNTTYPNFILLFRYNGDRAPLTNITITYTT